jgi:hypothetical protein
VIFEVGCGSSAQLSPIGFLPYRRRSSRPMNVKASELTTKIAQHQQLWPSGQDAHHKQSLRLFAVFGLKKTMTTGDVYYVSTVLCRTSRLLPRRLHIVPSYPPLNVPRRFRNDPIALDTSLAVLARFLGQ